MIHSFASIQFQSLALPSGLPSGLRSGLPSGLRSGLRSNMVRQIRFVGYVGRINLKLVAACLGYRRRRST